MIMSQQLSQSFREDRIVGGRSSASAVAAASELQQPFVAVYADASARGSKAGHETSIVMSQSQSQIFNGVNRPAMEETKKLLRSHLASARKTPATTAGRPQTVTLENRKRGEDVLAKDAAAQLGQTNSTSTAKSSKSRKIGASRQRMSMGGATAAAAAAAPVQQQQASAAAVSSSTRARRTRPAAAAADLDDNASEIDIIEQSRKKRLALMQQKQINVEELLKEDSKSSSAASSQQSSQSSQEITFQPILTELYEEEARSAAAAAVAASQAAEVEAPLPAEPSTPVSASPQSQLMPTPRGADQIVTATPDFMDFELCDISPIKSPAAASAAVFPAPAETTPSSAEKKTTGKKRSRSSIASSVPATPTTTAQAAETILRTPKREDDAAAESMREEQGNRSAAKRRRISEETEAVAAAAVPATVTAVAVTAHLATPKQEDTGKEDLAAFTTPVAPAVQSSSTSTSPFQVISSKIGGWLGNFSISSLWTSKKEEGESEVAPDAEEASAAQEGSVQSQI